LNDKRINNILAVLSKALNYAAQGQGHRERPRWGC
jgi:hypothetical protein